MSFLDSIFNPLFLWILDISPFWGIVILSLFITVLVTVVYKYVTDQNLMKSLKQRQKDYQKKLKELRSNPEEMMKVQKEAMKVNLEYMKHSFKPTLITMLPILLIFGWMAGHLNYEPIYPNETYGITAFFKESITGDAVLLPDNGSSVIGNNTQTIDKGEAQWQLKGNEGEHIITVKKEETQQAKKVLITKERKYEDELSFYDHSDITKIKINYKELKPLGPNYSGSDFSIFSWRPGWLGLYIIFSIIFSIILRKVMKVY